MSLSPSRWQEIATVYESALDRDAAAREAFLAEACAGDEALRLEVESLLRQDEAAVMVDRSVWASGAALLDDVWTLDAGATLGPYRIEDRLGAGGMGDVYRAIDTRLNRPVAVKVLPTGVAVDPQMRARFAGEAQAIAALKHPHICTLYDVGRQDDIDFLVMEHLEGETLAARLARGRLPVGEALTCAIEIAAALAHAHERDVVHRDLKPANIMLTTGGTKLLDFGLAKFLAVATPAAQPRDLGQDPVARPGTLIGTIRYMAPEQLNGQDGDARSDLFSFGAVLYEMLTGTRAFDGHNAAGIRTAILERDPPAASSIAPLVPGDLDDVVHRCLEKNPEQRWQTAGDVLGALKQVSGSLAQAPVPPLPLSHSSATQRGRRWAGGLVAVTLTAVVVWVTAGGLQRWRVTPTPGEIRSIAVLPLESLSSGEEHESFADGMTEQLIADLASVDGLRVISRTSVMQYKATRKPVPVIARELRVDAIIEGTILEADSHVRITAKLISGATGEIIWIRPFERDLRDVPALRREVARSVTASVGPTVTGQQAAPPASVRTVDPAVHRQVLLGRHHAAKGTEEGLRKAGEFFSAAIARDPASAAAYAGLAETYTELSGYYMDPRQAMPRAKDAAETAIRLDETLADAHAALGYAKLVYDWDGPAAERALLHALHLNPSLATARLNYAAYLSTQDRLEDARREIRRAVDLDPLSVRTHAFGGMLLVFTRAYDEALDLARRGLELAPDSGFTVAVQGMVYAELGRYNEAVEHMQRAAQLDNSLTILALQAHVLAVAGRSAQAVAVLRQVEEAARHRYFCPYEIATVYVSLGDHDTAAALFRKGTRERADCMAWLGVEPWIAAFRTDARYLSLLRDIGLTPVPR
jgi:serine/threonine-protein kinase